LYPPRPRGPRIRSKGCEVQLPDPGEDSFMSTSETEASPYDDGALYDLAMGEYAYDLDYYTGLARAAAGPILEVCCGTGRVTLPCLRAGLDIEGLDLAPALLDRLRHKATAQGLQPRLHQDDMRSFRLDRRYALIMITGNAFVHNLTTEDQVSTLSC